MPRGVGLPEAEEPAPGEATPPGEAAPAREKPARPRQPRIVDDRYGPGALGPRILLHESESVEVPPQRLEVRLLAGDAGSAEGPREDEALRKDTGGKPLPASAEVARPPRPAEGKARLPRPVRVWEVREPQPVRPASPLAPAEVDVRAYLAALGIRSVYDLAPGSRRLTLPRGPQIGRSPVRGGALAHGSGSGVSMGEWDAMIQEAGRLFGLDPQFIAAMIKVESDFDHLAVSPAGAQGAMQIMPGTQAELGLEDPFDVRANIHAGCAYIHELLAQYGSAELALAAYNAGPGAVDKYGGIPPYPETRHYVRRVMALWQGEQAQPEVAGAEDTAQAASQHSVRTVEEDAQRTPAVSAKPRKGGRKRKK